MRWTAAGRSLEAGAADEAPAGLAAARAATASISAAELARATPPPAVIFVDTSLDFTRGHVPGARWVPRGWLELRIAEVAPSPSAALVVTCIDGRASTLAAAALGALGYGKVSVLDGGMAAWQRAGLAVEQGLSGVMAPPADVVPAGPDRNFADMQNYLRWEEALGVKYGSPAHSGTGSAG